MRIRSFKTSTLANIIPTGDSWPMTCDAVGLRYCNEELKKIKFPSRPAVAMAKISSQRG
ncbi:hypothetical protein D3C78_1901750 [compost metagenome]